MTTPREEHASLLAALREPEWWADVFVSLDVERRIVTERVGGLLDLLVEHEPSIIDGVCLGCERDPWRQCPIRRFVLLVLDRADG